MNPVTAYASKIAPVAVWRGVLAAVVGLLSYWTTCGGTFMHAPGAQVAIVVGIAVGLVAPGVMASGAIALGVYALGAFTGVTNFLVIGTAAAGTPLATLPWALLAGAIAAAVPYVVTAGWLRPSWLMWFAIALVVVNMWVTVYEANRITITDSRTGITVPSLTDLIEGAEAPEAMRRADDYFYLIVLSKLRSGVPYYQGASSSFAEVGDGSVKGPSGVLNLRQPILYVALSKLPSAAAMFALYLALVSVSAASVMWVVRDAVRAPLALPAAFAVVAYSIPFATTLQLFYTELWAGPIALIAFALFARSLSDHRWRWWMGGAIVAALIAFFVRELAGTLLIAGLLSAWFGPADRRRWALSAWAGACVIAIVGYAAHVWFARPFLTGAAGQSVWGRGGIEFSLSALTYNTLALGLVAAWTLACLGYVGAALMPDAGRRAWALVTLLVPLAVFLFIGNGARDTLTNAPVNYWGATFMPTAYACAPVALSLLPAAAPARRPRERGAR